MLTAEVVVAALGATQPDRSTRVAEAWRLLAGTGARRTVARALVIDALAQVDGHLSVGAIHERVAARNPEVNVSTVHRTVAFLVEHGVAHVLFRSGEGLYGLVDEPHHHAVCERCGALDELPAESLADVAVATEQLGRLRITGGTLTVTGLCAACRKLPNSAS